MAERNRPQPEGTEGLPVPYRGVFEEVYFDLLSDRQLFVMQAANALTEENPALATLLIRQCAATSDPSLSFELVLVYYEMFSRTARRKGKVLMEVSADRVSSFRHENLRETLRLGPEEMRKRQAEERGEEFEEEAMVSDDLGSFWSTMQLRVLDKPSGIRLPVYTLQSLLHSQSEANRLSRDFPLEE